MTLHPRFIDAVLRLHPAAVPLRDFAVRSDETGLHLVGWDLPLEPPTDAEVEALLPVLGRPTPAEVDAERDRRIASEFTFRGIRYDARPHDRENIAGAAQLAALALLMSGRQPGDLRWHGGPGDFEWIAADNSLVPMDAPAIIALARAAAAHHRAHIFAARAIKDRLAAGEAVDLADGTLWPA